jgi:hypothetical protein
MIDPNPCQQVPIKATAHAAFNKSRRNVTTPIVTSTPYPRRTTSPIGDPIEGYGMGPLSPTSPINSPPLRPQDWQDKRLQEYMSELTLEKEEELKRLQDQERQSNARLREQDILISELQEKLDLVEDALKDRKKELDKLRTNESRYCHSYLSPSDARMQEIVRSMEKEVEARELELSSWRDRYHNVKRSYDEQLAEAEKLRDMILGKEGENNVLKEKISSLQEDIDTVSYPVSQPS